MYLTKLAQRTGEDSNAVTYSDLASVVQVPLNPEIVQLSAFMKI